MNQPENNVFTASQIARALGATRQAVANGLADCVPVARVDVEGKPADAWPFDALPLEWKLEITRRGARRGFENGEQFLASLPVTPWKSPLPWDLVPKREQDKAVRLQRALARALALRSEPHTAPACDVASSPVPSPAMVKRAGLEDFKAEFGYSISAGHWRRLLARTVGRDGGEENWQRLDIYLDDRAFKAAAPRRTVLMDEYQHRELEEVFSTLECRLSPTLSDRGFLWDAVFSHYERLTGELADTPEGNRKRRQAKASLAHFLFKAFPQGVLCATEASLKRRFDEKLAVWRERGRSPAALEDKRPVKSGRFRKSQFPKDLEAIRNRAILHDGNISLAYRLLHEEGKLSKEFCEFYPFDVRTAKSEVPNAVRDAVAPLVEMCLPLRLGPWQAKMRGPYIPRDWSEVKPGDWFNADDVTLNHYFREQAVDGRWRLHRGECLLMTDLRTGYPLDFLLIAGNYNGEHVRSLALKVHDRIGLPRRGYYFERGVWRSRLIVGDHSQGTPVHWREAENGLCSVDLKLEVRHATTPRAKPIEGLLRILQERMRCIPGFVGFNERTDEREREQELIARANNGDEEALKRFPTQAEWAATISGVLEKFAHDPQNGAMLEGKSPAEAWAEEVRNRPLRQLPEEARYVLSTHKKEITVRQEGIILTIRGQRRIYFNEHTGKFIGRTVLAFYNLEMPELLTVSDIGRQNYFTVRAVKLPAMSATREQLEEVNRLRKAHMAPAKAIFGGIKHDVVSTITRDREQSDQAKELGRFHNDEMARAKAQDSERGRKLRKLQTKLAGTGIELDGPVRDIDEALSAADRREMYLARLRQRETAGAPTESEP